MNVTSLSQIEKEIGMLPPKEQLMLMERIIHRLRKSNLREDDTIENQLAAMAADPEIQRELSDINGEFAQTEWDGLEKM
jgi:vacuolar-type H+-ATPase subunit B/Vma2